MKTFYLPINDTLLTDAMEIKNYMVFKGWFDVEGEFTEQLPEKIINNCQNSQVIILQFPISLYTASILGIAWAFQKPIVIITRDMKYISTGKEVKPFCIHPCVFERIVADDLLTLCSQAHKQSKKAVREYDKRNR